MRQQPGLPTSPPGGVDVWQRWMPAWHVYNLGVLVATTLLALTSGQVSDAELPGVLGVSAMLVVGYWVTWMQDDPWSRPTRLRIAHAVLLLGTFAFLLHLAPAFAFLQFALYAQLFFILETRLAVVAGLSVGVIMAGHALADTGGDVADAAPEMVLQLAAAAAFTMLSAWIGAIIVQSAERQALLQQLAATRAELAAAEREAGVADERARLSREIHDTLAQGFASVVTHLEAADAVLDTDTDRARTHVQAAEAVARASLDEARGLVWTLRPAVLADGGLPAALQRVVAGAGPGVELTISGVARPLHPEVEVTLLRAAQEALTNAHRHAHTTRVSVTLTYFDDEVSLDVIDDGQGFDPAAIAPPGPDGGHGLRGMRERAERLAGRLDIESTPGEGTAIALALPALPAPSAPRP